MLLATPTLAQTVGIEAAVILTPRPLPIFAFITHRLASELWAGGAPARQPPPQPATRSGGQRRSDTSGYGEWFSDWNALPAVVATRVSRFDFFWYEDTNRRFTAATPRQDQLRVTVNFVVMR